MKYFSFPVRVYFSDTDAGGIVYHTNYLNFAEHARTEALREVFRGSQQEMLSQDIAFVVKSISISYEKPGFLDDELCVETSVKEAKRFSVIFLQVVKRGEDVLASIETKVGCISLSKKRPFPIPEDVLKSLTE